MAMSSGLRRKGLLLSFCHCSHRSSALLGILDHSSRQSLLHHRNRVVVARHIITTTMMSSSATPGPDAVVGRHQRDERIRDDKIFFIELGFGNDSHGQVRRFSAFISLFAPPLSFFFFVRTMRCSAGRMAESMSSPRRVHSPHTILTRQAVLLTRCGCTHIAAQSSTKAAVRACRNAIEFNSIPSIRRLIPDVSANHAHDVM